jgi:hypothetical protein
MIRIIAEPGYASLYSSIHRLLLRHQDWQSRFKLKDQWVTVNPTEWQERANLTVAVGLGNASKEEVQQSLMLMGQAQQVAAQVPGLIQPKNVFALFRRMQTQLGFENDDFITDPQSPEYQQFTSQPPPPDPYIEGEKIKSETKMQEKQVDAQVKSQEQNQRLAFEAAQHRDDMALEITKLEVQSGIDLAKAGIGAEVAIARGNQQASARSSAAAGKPPAARGSGSAGGRPR